MRKSITETAPLVLVAALAAGCTTQKHVDVGAVRASDQGFVALFDGASDGASVSNVFAQILDSRWTVENGALVSRQDPNGRRQGESWLLTKSFYADFALRVKFRITPGGNSGVFVRVPVSWQERQAAPDGGPVPWDTGYEANINNDEPNYPTGSIWALAGGPKKLQREGEWNDLEIIVVGRRIWTWVNGRAAVQDFELPERAASGAIGFQRHGGEQYRDKLIEVKDVWIREL